TKRDRLFRSDAQTGWSNAPNLLTTRINAAGEEWSIRTDQNGQRLIAQDPRARRRILILGDSLSFGEGIDIEDRFEVKMLSSLLGARAHRHHGLRNRPGVRGFPKLEAPFRVGRYRLDRAQSERL